eukprot:15435305-Alexandrium_andersonii.AAC.1
MELLWRMDRNLGEANQSTFADHLQALGEVRIAGGCSGSNVTGALCKAFIQDIYGTDVNELFVCEKDVKKKTYLKWLCWHLGDENTHIFGDVGDLGNASAHCHNYRRECAIPSCQGSAGASHKGPYIFHAGFSCKNFSKLYNIFQASCWQRAVALHL